jgi:hypothetical protein
MIHGFAAPPSGLSEDPQIRPRFGLTYEGVQRLRSQRAVFALAVFR